MKGPLCEWVLGRVSNRLIAFNYSKFLRRQSDDNLVTGITTCHDTNTTASVIPPHEATPEGPAPAEPPAREGLERFRP